MRSSATDPIAPFGQCLHHPTGLHGRPAEHIIDDCMAANQKILHDGSKVCPRAAGSISKNGNEFRHELMRQVHLVALSENE